MNIYDQLTCCINSIDVLTVLMSNDSITCKITVPLHLTVLQIAPCKVIRNPQSRQFWSVESGIHGFGIRNPANGIWNPPIVIQSPLGCWNPVSCDGPLLFLLATFAWKSHVARMRNRYVHACFTRRNISCHCDISGINLKQWSHYNDGTESQVVIHITVYYRSLSDTLSTGPFDLFLRCA